MRLISVFAFVLLAAPALGQARYCGTDVPYDLVVDGQKIEIENNGRVTLCKFNGSAAACEDGAELAVEIDGTTLTLGRGTFDPPVVMPLCTARGQ